LHQDREASCKVITKRTGTAAGRDLSHQHWRKRATLFFRMRDTERRRRDHEFTFVAVHAIQIETAQISGLPATVASALGPPVVRALKK
jgi:hypothetical protein